ncbi:MAG: LCP family protein [Candidatus Baltobacteraceae bacterium]
MGKHLVTEDEPGHDSRRGFFGWLWIALAGALALVLGYVAMQAIVQRRSPAWIVGNAANDATGFFIPKPQTYFSKDRIAILLLGIDYNYDDKDQEYSSGSRSDTIMAVSLNFPTDSNPKPSVSVLSVPRDMDYVLPNGTEEKINASYALGGASAAQKTVADFLGIPPFDRYVVLRINAAKEVVDAIGGIDVVPDATMNYDDTWGHLHIHFVGGKKYHMNGEQAVSYSRFRHDACGDPCRIKRQQQVVRIVLDKLKSDKFHDLGLLRSLIGIVNRNVITDLKPTEELSLAWAFKAIGPHDVVSDQVPYVDDKEVACCGDVLIPDDRAKLALVHKFFLDPLLPQTPVDRARVATIAPASIRVDVLNGSGTPGLATRVAGALRAQGFTIGIVGDAPAFTYAATEIHVHSTAQPLAGQRLRIALPVPSATVEPDPVPSVSPTSDVTLIVGSDYPAPPAKEASAVK